jgi:hypothetical protein
MDNTRLFLEFIIPLARGGRDLGIEMGAKCEGLGLDLTRSMGVTEF